MKQISDVSGWLLPLLSFGVFVLSLAAYVFLEVFIVNKSVGTGALLSMVQVSGGSAVTAAAMAVSNTRRR